MSHKLFSQFLFTLLLFINARTSQLSADENFVLLQGNTSQIVFETGSRINEQISPCSSFKIVLSLMGFDAGILKDEKDPIWLFQEGYDTFLEVWKKPQTPQSWMKTSCVWYSRVLAKQLGLEKIQKYLGIFNYGNQDMSGGLTEAWISSSLKISPKEQAEFIRKLIHGDFPIFDEAVVKTSKLTFVESLPGGWNLYGKTGMGYIYEQEEKNMLGWFVGWIENKGEFYSFAYNIRDKKIDLGQRIPRVKQFLLESSVLSNLATQ